MIINSINDIYQSKYLNNVKITNVGNGSNDAPDVAGQIIGQMLNTYSSLEQKMLDNNSKANDQKAIIQAKK